MEPTRRCTRCGHTYKGEKEIAFAFRMHRAGTKLVSSQRKTVCGLCEQDRRTEKAQANRFRLKAVSARRRHARKFGLTVEQLEGMGWVIDRMAREAAHHYGNGCTECGHPYEEMGHGTRDITLDIWDPHLPPEYGSNTRWVCNTCNMSKGDLTPEGWIIKKRLYRERAAFLAATSGDPRYGRNWEQPQLTF